MKTETRKAIRAVMATDDTISADELQRASKLLLGREAIEAGRPLLLTQADAARLLGVSRITVYRMVKAGDVVPVKVRGAVRYRRSDLESIAKGQ